MGHKESISNEQGNWYIVELIQKCEPTKRDEQKELRRVVSWSNHHLIKADSVAEAYEKAVLLGKEGEYKFINTDKLEMEWIFVGIGNLLPIYEDAIEDGTELMWEDHGLISNRKTQRMAKSKEEILKQIKTRFPKK